MGAVALAPSRAWFPGRRGNQTCHGARPSFNPTNCWPISDRSHVAQLQPHNPDQENR